MTTGKTVLGPVGSDWMVQTLPRSYRNIPDYSPRDEERMPGGPLPTPGEVAPSPFLGRRKSYVTGSVVDFDQSVLGAGSQPTLDPGDVP